MSGVIPDQGDPLAVPIASRDQLAATFEMACKPRSAWRIGTEHEKFGFRLDDLRTLPYDGPCSILALLTGLQRFGWQPVHEGDKLIALARGPQSITLEPGGQLELAGAPVETLHQTCAETNAHLVEVGAVAEEIGAGFLALGFQPKWRLDEIPVMPKGRYGIMQRYMPTRGSRGLDMMFRTCTVQVNLDFQSEADMRAKYQVSLALQPLATALFANSPFVEGKPSGYLTTRALTWTDTDPDRCGTPGFVLEPGFGFEAYVDYALNVPMYFVYRGRYIDAAGQSFKDFMAGRLPALPGEIPTLRDWSNHLTTLFPEVRLKGYLEMRGADGGPQSRLCALPALWVGLLYDDQALAEGAELIRGWTGAELRALHRDLPRLGLAAPFRGTTVLALARRMLAIADGGLKRRRRLDSKGRDESRFLAPLHEIAERGRCPAEELLDAYASRWQASVDPAFVECRF